MKLSKCKRGKKYIVKEINGNQDTVLFLRNIGLEIGDTVTVISKLGSNLIINIKDSRFGIDSSVAKLVEVEQ